MMRAQIAAEKKATERVQIAVGEFFDALETKDPAYLDHAPLDWVWRWGDGEGGYLFQLIALEANRRGWLNRSTDAFILRSEVSELAMRDGLTCHYCQSLLAGHPDAPFPHVDHVIPRSQGGSDSLENKVLSCPRCNLSKGGRSPEQWKGAIDP